MEMQLRINSHTANNNQMFITCFGYVSNVAFNSKKITSALKTKCGKHCITKIYKRNN